MRKHCVAKAVQWDFIFALIASFWATSQSLLELGADEPNVFARDDFDREFQLPGEPIRLVEEHVSLTKNPGKLTITTQIATSVPIELAFAKPFKLTSKTLKSTLCVCLVALSASVFVTTPVTSQDSKATTMTLSEQLAEKAAGYAKRAPADKLAAGSKGIETVRATGIEKSAKQVGDAAIDGQLTQEEMPQMVHAIETADPDCFYYHHVVEGISRRYYIAPIG